jgi:hypothetical protein
VSIRDQILSAKDSHSELVEIPEWGVTVQIQSMSGAARAVLMQEAMQTGGNINMAKVYPDLIIQTCLDPETGEPVFTEDDREAILSKNGAILDRLAEVATRLSGFNDSAVDDAGKDS